MPALRTNFFRSCRFSSGGAANFVVDRRRKSKSDDGFPGRGILRRRFVFVFNFCRTQIDSWSGSRTYNCMHTIFMLISNSLQENRNVAKDRKQKKIDNRALNHYRYKSDHTHTSAYLGARPRYLGAKGWTYRLYYGTCFTCKFVYCSCAFKYAIHMDVSMGENTCT